MKIRGYSFMCEDIFFVYFKKHFCPCCGNRLMRKKVSKIVHSDSEEAKNYDFEVADTIVTGNVKFAHIEFCCPFCRKCYTVKEVKQNRVNTLPEEVLQKKTLDEIWLIEDKSELIIALSQHVTEKCRYGDNMCALSEPERMFFVTQILEMEVNNGGFSQFFFNYSGEYANEVVDAFAKIGATKTAEICKKAVSIYGQSVPADRNEREALLLDNDEVNIILEECDDAFFAYEEDLTALNYGYVMKNRGAFL